MGNRREQWNLYKSKKRQSESYAFRNSFRNNIDLECNREKKQKRATKIGGTNILLSGVISSRAGWVRLKDGRGKQGKS